MSLDIKNPRSAKYDNNEAIQSAFPCNESAVYYNASLSSSTDPFAGKTNKYAECELVGITPVDKGVCVRFSAAGTAAEAGAAGSFYVPPGAEKIFVVEPEKRYLRIIEQASAAKCWVREIT